MKTKRYGAGNPFKRIYLIAPRHPENFWSMQGTAALLGAKTLMPNAALPTLMALTPPEINVEYVLCDENVSELDWNMPCDLAVITGSTLHKKGYTNFAADFEKMELQRLWAALMPASTRINAPSSQIIILSVRRNIHGLYFFINGQKIAPSPFITKRPTST